MLLVPDLCAQMHGLTCRAGTDARKPIDRSPVLPGEGKGMKVPTGSHLATAVPETVRQFKIGLPITERFPT